MKNVFKLFLLAILATTTSCTTKIPASFVLVEGGDFINSTSGYYKKAATMPDFYMAQHEVTQQEWRAVLGTNPAQFKGDSLPVEMVSWYDCIDYCNARSIRDGLRPYYTIDKSQKAPSGAYDQDDVRWVITPHATANGYRLPTEAEWEYAASGGQLSRSYSYSGSNSVEDVAWYWQNSGDKYLTVAWSWPTLVKNNNRTKPVGRKAPNELGLYDMSGNVREWCWDWHEGRSVEEPSGRIWKGGGWIGADFCCASSFKASHQANGKGPDQGFRVCRGK